MPGNEEAQELMLLMVDHIKALRADVEAMKRSNAYQAAVLGAFQAWTCRQLAKVSAKEAAELIEELSATTRKYYEETLQQVGDTDPAFAELLDIRPYMQDGMTDKWQFPEWPTADGK